VYTFLKYGLLHLQRGIMGFKLPSSFWYIPFWERYQLLPWLSYVPFFAVCKKKRGEVKVFSQMNWDIFCV